MDTDADEVMNADTGRQRGPVRIGVLTSGGDAQGMNAAVRAVVRTGVHVGAQVYGIYEGYQGAVDGGDRIRRLAWDDVGNIMHRGGTVIGTARSTEFRERHGQLRAARNLLAHGIDRLVVIGGDGSLTGTNAFRENWPGLVEELAARGDISREDADAHPELMIVGLVGSIDNDLVGTETTIGADSALHRIIEAIDAISSTAASHQRTFVVEVMGRHCGYLPLFAAIAGGCDAVLIPENPPGTQWASDLCATLKAARAAGRRDSIVLVAEGAQDDTGRPIRAIDVRDVLRDRLGEDARVTILGHVQRGGTPSAYDRWMSTLLGYAAVHEVLKAAPGSTAHVLGVRHNRIARIGLVEAVTATRQLAQRIDAQDYGVAIQARGRSFREAVEILRRMAAPVGGGAATGRRVAVVHVGGLAPGMNSAAWAAVRLGRHLGHTMLGVVGGIPGLLDGHIRELDWSDVEGWVGEGGAELGTRRQAPTVEQLYALGRAVEQHEIDALVFIGGMRAYLTAHLLVGERARYPAFAIPIMCVPASIDNNLPRSELSIGADTALNSAVWVLDSVKQSASASTRCFVAESMGRRCGYLALMSGLASGAERVYLHEEGITLDTLAEDVATMRETFRDGRRLFLAIRNERASELYTTDFLARLFEQESDGLYDVRSAIIGHVQQGGNPSPFDRILATRLVHHALLDVDVQLREGTAHGRYIGLVDGEVTLSPIERMLDHVDMTNRRPSEQWWLELRTVVGVLAERAVQPHEPTVGVLAPEPVRL